jgi:hypothetical protein
MSQKDGHNDRTFSKIELPHKIKLRTYRMPASMLARFVLLPELNLTRVERKFPNIMILHAHKDSRFEVCWPSSSMATRTQGSRALTTSQRQLSSGITDISLLKITGFGY